MTSRYCVSLHPNYVARVADQFANSLALAVISETWIRTILARENTVVVHLPCTFDCLGRNGLIRPERPCNLIHPTAWRSTRFRN